MDFVSNEMESWSLCFMPKKVVDTEIFFEGAPSSRNSKANPFVVEFHRFAGYAMAAFVK